MLIREDVATELALATRVLAHFGALDEGRITARAGEVVYLPAKGVTNTTMTPYDVAAVWLVEEIPLRGALPDDAERYLAAYRGRPEVASAALAIDGTLVTAASLQECAVKALLLAQGRGSDDVEAVWREAEASARAAGALVGTEER